MKRKRPRYDEMRKKIEQLVESSIHEFTPYSVTTELFPDDYQSREWKNNYILVSQILVDMEREKKLKSKVNASTGRLLPKRLYKKVVM